VLEAVADYAQKKKRLRICTVNADFAIKSRRDQRLHDYICDADIATADGKPVLWAARFLGDPLPEKVSGSDLISQICEMAAQRSLSVYLLGALQPIAHEAAERLQQRYPGLRIAGAMSPDPERYHDVEYNREISEQIRISGADILMVGFGCPKQEFWIEDYQDLTGVPVTIGVGASIDFAAGRFKRAPVWMQQSGLEWFYRLCQEPTRLWRRYLVDDPPFFWHVLLQKFSQKQHPEVSWVSYDIRYKP
jgi:N-acetylglucosaminyldiphosphoundecaprenol N-acetyl-beta-D-mannosaminyltransferase